MKLVETDIHHAEDEGEVPGLSTPPRPEHRRVYVSFLVTFSVLVATVATIYTVFPQPRDNEMLTVALAFHEDPGEFELTSPSRAELVAFGVGVTGRGAPFPEPRPDLEALGVRSLRIVKWQVTMVRYRAGDDEVSYLVMRAHDAPPRHHRREEDGLLAVSWRSGGWTLIAVGPVAEAARWGKLLGVP